MTSSHGRTVIIIYSCVCVCQSAINHRTREALSARAYQWFSKRNIKAFYTIVDDASFKDGAGALLQVRRGGRD